MPRNENASHKRTATRTYVEQKNPAIIALYNLNILLLINDLTQVEIDWIINIVYYKSNLKFNLYAFMSSISQCASFSTTQVYRM